MKRIIAKLALIALIATTVAPVHAGITDLWNNLSKEVKTKSALTIGLTALALGSFYYGNKYADDAQNAVKAGVHPQHYTVQNRKAKERMSKGMFMVSIVGLLALLNPIKN